MPKGHFEGNSTYAGNYQETKASKNPKFVPQGQLKVGEGRFEGNSSYGQDYIERQGGQRAERQSHPANEVIPKGQFAGHSTYG